MLLVSEVLVFKFIEGMGHIGCMNTGYNGRYRKPDITH